MSSYLLLLIILIPLTGAFFTLSTKNDKNYSSGNIYNVSIWTMLLNTFLILYVFSLIDTSKQGIDIVEKYSWLSSPKIDLLLGVDVFSMLLLLSINLSFFIAEIFIYRKSERSKTLIASELLFVSLINGYFIAADISSFYIFFAAVSIPLIILISTYANISKKNILVRFSLYSIIGALLLMVATIMIFIHKENNIPLNMAGNVNMVGALEYFVWLSIFFAFISRLPVWPFHYWISAISSSIKNPLVFLVSNLIPLMGLYGFIRFWPNTVPKTIAVYAPVFEIICVITMIFIALISLSNKDMRYKLFAYTTVYYLLYLIGVFMPTNTLKQNIGYSLFSYIIIVTILSFIISHIEEQKKKLDIYSSSGILCYMPKASKCISLFILASIGLPITPLFWNNFIIISEIFNYNLMLGIFVMLSIMIIGISFLEELYKQKDKTYATSSLIQGVDMPNHQFVICLICMTILCLSFFKPLWFVF